MFCVPGPVFYINVINPWGSQNNLSVTNLYIYLYLNEDREWYRERPPCIKVRPSLPDFSIQAFQNPSVSVEMASVRKVENKLIYNFLKYFLMILFMHLFLLLLLASS